jgi:argininosuccinate lyase
MGFVLVSPFCATATVDSPSAGTSWAIAPVNGLRAAGKRQAWPKAERILRDPMVGAGLPPRRAGWRDRRKKAYNWCPDIWLSRMRLARGPRFDDPRRRHGDDHDSQKNEAEVRQYRPPSRSRQCNGSKINRTKGTPLVSKAWGGRFSQATDPRVEKFTESISFDFRLAAVDLRGSQAHARMLAKVGLLTSAECEAICQGLQEIAAEIQQGRFNFSSELEDIHMHVEQALIARLGDVGRKLHTARSRNDQVATDLRLYVRECIGAIDRLLAELQTAFIERGEADLDVIVPGYTHMQRAQPVLVVHYWLAYCEKFQRDRERLADCLKRVNVSPLGTAALAGTSLPIDREYAASLLGFTAVCANSLDASSDRDFLIEFAGCLALIAAHLSTWAEEWVLWSTTEFGYLRLPDAYTTGSSIMPQKRNPDVLELIRGKSARVMAAVPRLLTLVKGLPLAYQRDLQEDKVALFDAYDTVIACLELAPAIVAGAQLDRERIRAALDQGYLDATALMEYLIKLGVPMRTAHETVGRLVARCEALGCRLSDLALSELQRACADVGPEVSQVLGAENAVKTLSSPGSGGRASVEQQLWRWKALLVRG